MPDDPVVDAADIVDEGDAADPVGPDPVETTDEDDERLVDPTDDSAETTEDPADTDDTLLFGACLLFSLLYLSKVLHERYLKWEIITISKHVTIIGNRYDAIRQQWVGGYV